jgi:ABC-type molybdate transport system substrate-binding protein
LKRCITKGLVLAALLIMAMCVLSACGESAEEGNTGSSNGITIFNSKMEIQDQMLQMAERYTEKTGVPVEVYYSSDTVSAHLATKYASNNPYTLSMVDAKDVYSLAEEHAVDLSDQKWDPKLVNDLLIIDRRKKDHYANSGKRCRRLHSKQSHSLLVRDRKHQKKAHN